MVHSGKRLRIAIVSDAVHPYNKGGKELRIHELSTRLAEQGHDVHIYTMKWWEGDNHRLEHGVHLHAISRLFPLYSGQRRSIRQGMFFALACLKLVRERFDVIEVDHMPFFPLYTVKLVSLLKRKPMYATWHEVWGKSYWKEYLGKLGALAYVIEKFSIYMPSHIFAVSPLTADRLRNILRYRGPLTLANNGIDLAKIVAAPVARQTSEIMFVGRLLEHKNVDLLIRAMAILKASHPGIRCLIVGGGPEAERLQLLTQELKLQRSIKFLGFVVDDQDVYSLMKASKVFVLPSSREGFGITVLEANACSLPVITVDLPDNAAKDLIQAENGLVCPATPEDIADSIQRILHWSGHIDPRTIAGLYDWAKSAKKLEEAYVR